jgi:hypothetical protein
VGCEGHVLSCRLFQLKEMTGRGPKYWMGLTGKIFSTEVGGSASGGKM